ncbi:MAG TPA: DNA polymerase III subunit epsilon [Lysobacter sp.]|nr:DNA polymerase III subunit epsilon [Lysobacter sp.]
MRQVVLDTETTGLYADRGDRIVEIGCVELLERRPSGRTFHCYLNPDREFSAGAQEVTGLTLEFLADKPRFHEVAEEFLAFVEGAELVIHNAAFDIGFLDAELALLGAQFGRMHARCTVEDSLLLARQRYPGQRNSLDALCRRLGVDNAHRQLHGALLDAQLLAEVYLAMTSGQSELGLSPAAGEATRSAKAKTEFETTGERPRVRVEAEELKEHRARLQALQKKAGRCLWLEIDAAG